MHGTGADLRVSGRRRVSISVAGCLAAVVALLAGVTSARATSFVYSNGFGATGIATPLNTPSYDAIDPVGHFIYVASDQFQSVNTIERFNEDGTPAPFTTTSQDVSGNVLGVADSGGDAAVFRGGDPQGFTCGGQTADDANGIRCFDQPRGIAVDENGDVFVANSRADTVEIFDNTGTWIGEIGPSFDSTHQNGTGHVDTLNEPEGLAYDTTNDLLFIASGQGQVVVFQSNGAAVPAFRLVGYAVNGSGSSGSSGVSYPQGLATDDNGNLYIADVGNSRIDHWTYGLSGNTLVSVLAGTWSLPGTDAEPEGITYTAGDGNQTPASIFVSDESAEDVLQFSPAGTQLAAFGGHGGAVGQFEDPLGVAALASDGSRGTNLYVVNQGQNVVQDFVPSPPVNTAPPAISGTAQAGQTLSATTGTWADVTNASTYSYTWMQCDAGGNSCASIQTGAANTLPLPSGSVGDTIKVAVVADNGQSSQPALSALTSPVAAAATVSGAMPTLTPVATPAPTPSAVTVTGPSSTNTRLGSLPATVTTRAALGRKGQAIKVTTVSGAKVTLELLLDKKTAKTVGLGNGKRAVVVGTATVDSVAGTSATIRAILTEKARTALARLHKPFQLTLLTTFTLGGQTYTINRVETVREAKAKRKTKK